MEHFLGCRSTSLGLRERILQASRHSMPSADARDTCDAEEICFLERALPGYQIRKCIHSGTQSVVYEALHRPSRREVALKLLLDGPLASAAQRRRFEREIALISRLQHPNIVTVHGSGIVRGRCFLATAMIQGVPLDDYVFASRLTVQELVRLFIKVCDAVAYAHQQGIIHRDLKPPNILVDERGEPHILDFGLAKDGALADDGSASLTLTGQVFGTVPYLSPEQALGRRADEVDARADVYALGVLLFELLTGMHPYPVDGPFELVRDNILFREPTRPRRALARNPAWDFLRPDDICDNLEAIVQKALAKDRGQRYQSVAELSEDLHRYACGAPVQAEIDHFHLLRRSLRRYRRVLCLVVLQAVTLVAGGWFLFKAREETERAEATVDIAFSALNHVLSTVEKSAHHWAGGAASQEALLAALGGDIADLQKQDRSDQRCRQGQALLYERQGDLAAALGRPDKAIEFYHLFLESSRKYAEESAGEMQPSLDVVRAFRKLAGAGEAPAEYFDAALKRVSGLVAGEPPSGPAHLELCETRLAAGHALLNRGYVPQAHCAASAAHELAAAAVAREGSARWVTLLATSCGLRGAVHLKRGEDASGLEALRRFVELRRRLAMTDPTNLDASYREMLANLEAGRAYQQCGEPRHAREMYEQAIDISRGLLRTDPRVLTWRHDSYVAHHSLARLLLDSDLWCAARHASEAAQLAEELVAAQPHNQGFQRILAGAYDLRAHVHACNKDWIAAAGVLQQSAPIREHLVMLDSEDLTLRSELAGTYELLGQCHRMRNNPISAWSFYRDAHQIRRELSERMPSSIEFQLRLILAQVKLAIWDQDFRQDPSAEVLFRHALQSLQELHASGALTHREAELRRWADNIVSWIRNRASGPVPEW